MKIASMFDGISCGREAARRAGIQVDEYLAYEIDEPAIRISKRNWKDIKHMGDIIPANFKECKGFDLVIGGSPCQSLSSSNVWLENGEYGVNGTGKSRLFWEFKRALLIIKPKYFLFENVASMRNADRDIITRELGVQPLKINSSIFSAQNRSRYYWTNIDFKIPSERVVSTTLQDILEPKVDPKYYISQKMLDFIMKPASGGWQSGKMQIDLEIARPITATVWKMRRADTDNYVTVGDAPKGKTNVRRLTPTECERLQTLPDGYTAGEKDKDRYTTIGNAWTVDVVAWILRGLKNGLYMS